MTASGLRVAVVTTEARAVSNALWFAARGLVADLVLIGDGKVDAPLPAFQTALPARDFGRGLIYRHLHGLGGILDDFRPDLVHINGELWALTAQEILRRREHVVVHGAENMWRHGNGVERFLRDRLVARAIPRLAGYVSWNEAGRRYVAAKLPPGVPTLTLPAIIPPPEFPSGSWGGRQEPPYVLLLVGALVRQKGFDTVISAVAGTPDPRQYRIEICGAGPEATALEAQASRLGVDLTLLGHVPAAALAERMASAWCLVQPSRAMPDNLEQFGRNVAESATVGLPAIVSDCGELARVLGTPAGVFPQEDAGALGRLLERLRTDREGYEAVRAEQHSLSVRWRPDVAARRLVEFWEDVAAQGERRRPANAMR